MILAQDVSHWNRRHWNDEHASPGRGCRTIEFRGALAGDRRIPGSGRKTL